MAMDWLKSMLGMADAAAFVQVGDYRVIAGARVEPAAFGDHPRPFFVYRERALTDVERETRSDATVWEEFGPFADEAAAVAFAQEPQ